MSTNLYWQPARKSAGNSLPDALKFALRKRYRNQGCVVNVTVTESDMEYLSGLRDAGVQGAQTLIEAIEQHGHVCLEEQ